MRNIESKSSFYLIAGLNAADIERFPWKPCRGGYKLLSGECIEEPSHLVICSEAEALKLGYNAGQESILFVNENRDATLIYCLSGATCRLGKFSQCNEEIAKAAQGYTYDVENRQYYTCL